MSCLRKVDGVTVTANEPSSIDPVALAATIEEQGYVIIPDAIDHDFCDALIDEIKRIEHDFKIADGVNDFEGFHTKRIFNVLTKIPLFGDAAIHPRVLPVVEAVLDTGLLLSGITSMNIGPDETPQLLHADDGMITLPRPHPATMVTTLWALSEFREENGATRIVAGSHKWPNVLKPGQAHESIAAEMPKGGVVVLHASTWHGGGANVTDQRRFGMSVQYVAGWCRQQQNLMLGLAPALVATFPTRLQELIGYSMYRNVMGHVDRQHPAVLLGGQAAPEMVWDKLSGPQAARPDRG
jgi:ectoine hydroxylase-related dioxygenase (phytanoyl-CoA dioxygenase family)